MSSIDPETLRQTIAQTQGIRLDKRAIARVADGTGRAVATLDVLAGGGLFDTEPANFERMLAALSGDGDD